MLNKEKFWDLDFCDECVSTERINFIEKIIGKIFPHLFLELVKICDGGYPLKDAFAYFDIYHQSMIISGVGAFLYLNDSNSSDFLKIYKNPPEFFPEGLIAFADNGGGDFICFDYRMDKESKNPPIVFWSHGADKGKDVSFIAKNFEEFIGMLYEPEDDN